MMGARARDWLKRSWPALVVAIAILWQFGAPLVGRVWFFEDIAAYFVPLYTAAARVDALRASFRRGSSAPGRASRSSAIRSSACSIRPIGSGCSLHPARAYAWLQLVHAVVGADGHVDAGARARAVDDGGGAGGADARRVGAFFVLELRHAMFVATTAWMPWMLWGIERLARERTIDHALFVAHRRRAGAARRRLVDAGVGRARRRRLCGRGDRARRAIDARA